MSKRAKYYKWEELRREQNHLTLHATGKSWSTWRPSVSGNIHEDGKKHQEITSRANKASNHTIS